VSGLNTSTMTPGTAPWRFTRIAFSLAFPSHCNTDSPTRKPATSCRKRRGRNPRRHREPHGETCTPSVRARPVNLAGRGLSSGGHTQQCQSRKGRQTTLLLLASLPGTDLHTPGLTASVTFDQAPGGGWTNPEPRSSGVMGKTPCSAHTGNKYLIFELPFRLGRLGSL
jgi:hypothetical protein